MALQVDSTRAVTVPSTVQHFVLKMQSTAANEWVRCVQRAIEVFQPSRCLLFAPDQDSVQAVVQQLHRHNLTGANLLHETIGFHTNRRERNATSAAKVPATSTAMEKLGALQNDVSTRATHVPILVTSSEEHTS